MPKKLIITHIFPDFDAITSVWLLQRFDSQWTDAGVEFVVAGQTLKGEAADSDPDVIHVDTGLGRFDHHQLPGRTCAAKLVLEWLLEEKKIPEKYRESLRRLIEVVTQVDNFEDCYWPEATADRYDLGLPQLFDYLKLSSQLNDKELVFQGILLLDAVLFGLTEKVRGEAEITAGVQFESIYGRSLGLLSQQNWSVKLAQKKGYNLVVKKEPRTDLVAIKCQPKPELDLTKLYEALKKADPTANWYFHQSKHIILNGSRHNPKVVASRLSLEELIELIKSI